MKIINKHCEKCGTDLNKNEQYCSNCGEKNENNSTITAQNRLYGILCDLIFVNSLIMVYYTFYKEAGNLGVMAALFVGPLLIVPQTFLELMNVLKKFHYILNIIFIFCGLISTILTLKMFNYNINTFIILNIILLISMLVYLLVSKERHKNV